MKLILEEVTDVQYSQTLDEATGKKSMFIEGIFLQGGIKNRNGRMYPVEILAKEVNRYNEEYVKKNRAFGELGHPNGPQINLDRISHMHKELRQEGGNFWGKAKLMDTPCGKIAKDLIGEGASLGVSSRGMGSVRPNKEGVNEVQGDFHLATAADIVVDPSAPDAWVQGIMENKEWALVNGVWMEQTAEIVRQEVEQAVVSRTLDTRQKFKLFEKFINVLAEKQDTNGMGCVRCGESVGGRHSCEKQKGQRVDENDFLARK
jgi:hypothetical protein